MSNDSVFVDQFICNVCHMVPNNSVLSRCCERMFCKQCIERIINRKSVCPVDNKPLTARDVMTVPKMVVNLRNKLRVKCDNYRLGCEVITTVAQLKTHLCECPLSASTSVTSNTPRATVRALTRGSQLSDPMFAKQRRSNDNIAVTQQICYNKMTFKYSSPLIEDREESDKLSHRLTIHPLINRIHSITEVVGYKNTSFEEIRYLQTNTLANFNVEFKSTTTLSEEWSPERGQQKVSVRYHSILSFEWSFEEIRLIQSAKNMTLAPNLAIYY